MRIAISAILILSGVALISAVLAQEEPRPLPELKGQISVLRVLDDLSTRVAKEMTAEFSLFNYTKSRPSDLPAIESETRTQQTTPRWDATVTLKGTAPSVADHVRLKEILEELDYVALLEDKGTTEAGGGRVNVEYILRLKAPTRRQFDLSAFVAETEERLNFTRTREIPSRPTTEGDFERQSATFIYTDKTLRQIAEFLQEIEKPDNVVGIETLRITPKNAAERSLLELYVKLFAVVRPRYVQSEPTRFVSQGEFAGEGERKTPLSAARWERRLTRIVDGDIFDAHRLQETKAEVPPPPPPLGWVLVGVTSIRGEPAAIIRDMEMRTRTGHREYVVREGDEVEGYFGVRITSIGINPPSVTYNRPGVGDETLTMETTATGTPGSTKDQWAETIRAVRVGHTYVVKLPELQVRVGSVEAYMGTFGSEPNMEGTRSSGLKITSLANDNLLYVAGLREGDTIKAINGMPVTDQASTLAQLAEAAKGLNVQLQVERARTSRTMFYTLLKQ